MIGYSFGTLLTLEIAGTLEAYGKSGKIVMIDGSPLFFKRFTEFLGHANLPNEHIENEILTGLLRMDFPDDYENILKNVIVGDEWSAKLDSLMTFYDTKSGLHRKYTKEWIQALAKRSIMTKAVNEASFPHLKSSKISLVVPNDKLLPDLIENYNLNLYCSENVETLVLNGNHVSILHNDELPKFINSLK